MQATNNDIKLAQNLTHVCNENIHVYQGLKGNCSKYY